MNGVPNRKPPRSIIFLGARSWTKQNDPANPTTRQRSTKPLDRQSWEAAVEASWPRLVRALSGLAGDRDRAENALQDAVEDALKPGVIERIERADAWLYAVATRRLRRGLVRSALSLLRAGSAPAPSIDRVATLELLNGLSGRQREFVIARYYLDLSYRDIAEEFGVSVGTATATVTQALKRLRTRINANPEELKAWKTG